MSGRFPKVPRITSAVESITEKKFFDQEQGKALTNKMYVNYDKGGVPL